MYDLLYEFKLNNSFLLTMIELVVIAFFLVWCLYKIFCLFKTRSYKKLDMIIWVMALFMCFLLSYCGLKESLLYVNKYIEYKEILESEKVCTIEGKVKEWKEDPVEHTYASFKINDVEFSYSINDPVIGYNGSCKYLGIKNNQQLRIRYINDYEACFESNSGNVILSIERMK